VPKWPCSTAHWSTICCAKLRTTCALGLLGCQQKPMWLTILLETWTTTCWNSVWTSQLQRPSGLTIWSATWNWDRPYKRGNADSLVPALLASMWPTLETRRRSWSWSSSYFVDRV
jgi:hypothetical protein